MKHRQCISKQNIPVSDFGKEVDGKWIPNKAVMALEEEKQALRRTLKRVEKWSQGVILRKGYEFVAELQEILHGEEP